MPQERLPMRQVRDVLRLKAAGLRRTQIAAGPRRRPRQWPDACAEREPPASPGRWPRR